MMRRNVIDSLKLLTTKIEKLLLQDAARPKILPTTEKSL
jgi:hypothetical protein